MSRPQTFEQSLLQNAEDVLSGLSSYEERLEVIEACASLIGHFDIDEYWKLFKINRVYDEHLSKLAHNLREAILDSGIPKSMALSSLSREPIPVSEQKKQGVFYTDYRLATLIKNDCEPYLKKNSKIADLSAGSGILLAGLADSYYELYPNNYNKWIENNVFAFDLSEYALRGARIALSVHTSSVESLYKMASNWGAGDSLFSDVIDSNTFDIVVGNPPWGKVKLTRHSFALNTGTEHIYGSNYGHFNENQYRIDKSDSIEYSKKLKEKYSLLGNSETDMYMAFLQKVESVLRNNGHLSFIVPAGLIRSQGTEPLRRYLINNSKKLRFYLLDNKLRFFEIDTRFKFVVLSQDKKKNSQKSCTEITLSILNIKGNEMAFDSEVTYDLAQLESIRPDLTIPECKTDEEKSIFLKICNNGINWNKQWGASIVREVDMTNNRQFFHPKESETDIPVIEGRMVQQFRFGAKAYISGSGRSAKWIPCCGLTKPQFYISNGDINAHLEERISNARIGYCDIAGQTNERAMMSCIIPSNVVCGNKVPTIVFSGDVGQDLMHYWVGVTNSFVFDWILRRVLSTTVNYFLLFSLPFPNIDLEGPVAQHIISNTYRLTAMQEEYYTGTQMPQLRAEIDLLVAQAYGITVEELITILNDFPLLDRGQPTIRGESKSYVTRDTILALAEKYYGQVDSDYVSRLQEYLLVGAKAYIPSEMTVLCQKEGL